MILYYGVEHGYHVEFYAYSQTIFWNENMYKIQKHKAKNFLFIDNDINVDITKTKFILRTLGFNGFLLLCLTAFHTDLLHNQFIL